jgi:hypothetical protein
MFKVNAIQCFGIANPLICQGEGVSMRGSVANTVFFSTGFI